MSQDDYPDDSRFALEARRMRRPWWLAAVIACALGLMLVSAGLAAWLMMR